MFDSLSKIIVFGMAVTAVANTVNYGAKAIKSEDKEAKRIYAVSSIASAIGAAAICNVLKNA